MQPSIGPVRETTRQLRRSPGYLALGPTERQQLEADLRRIEDTLAYGAADDPFAVPLETPADLRRGMPPPGPPPGPPTGGPPSAPPPPAGTEVLGQRARQTLEAVDFPSFVTGLIQGTFQAIVDATGQQVREYARLVASISRSVDDFSKDNVSSNQVRDWLAERHPADLQVVLPRPGEKGSPRLLPRRRDGEPPAWLEQYALGGQDLTPELTEGPLLDAARRTLGEERLQTLATMVLMGINRIVVDDGRIRARLQFHAQAREQVKAEMVGANESVRADVASRSTGNTANIQTMVSTVNANAQSDVALKADLLGEVSIRFRTETFNLERFADSQAIQLINRHARLQNPGSPVTQGAPARPPGNTPDGGGGQA